MDPSGSGLWRAKDVGQQHSENPSWRPQSTEAPTLITIQKQPSVLGNGNNEDASFVVMWVSPEVVPLSILLLEAYLV